jgi:Lhr-like helicase
MSFWWNRLKRVKAVIYFYPFEGRLVHEVMAALIAYRISKLYPISFSMAMNDYGLSYFRTKKLSCLKMNFIRSCPRKT